MCPLKAGTTSAMRSAKSPGRRSSAFAVRTGASVWSCCGVPNCSCDGLGQLARGRWTKFPTEGNCDNIPVSAESCPRASFFHGTFRRKPLSDWGAACCIHLYRPLTCRNQRSCHGAYICLGHVQQRPGLNLFSVPTIQFA
jgi:hypothetical protein